MLLDLVRETLRDAERIVQIVRTFHEPMNGNGIPRFVGAGHDRQFSHYEFIENTAFLVAPRTGLDITDVHQLNAFMRRLIPEGLKGTGKSFKYQQGQDGLHIRFGYVVLQEPLGENRSRYATLLAYPHQEFAHYRSLSAPIREIMDYAPAKLDFDDTQPIPILQSSSG